MVGALFCIGILSHLQNKYQGRKDWTSTDYAFGKNRGVALVSAAFNYKEPSNFPKFSLTVSLFLAACSDDATCSSNYKLHQHAVFAQTNNLVHLLWLAIDKYLFEYRYIVLFQQHAFNLISRISNPHQRQGAACSPLRRSFNSFGYLGYITYGK